MKEYKVMASNLHGTYTVGQFVASNATEAIEMARNEYRRSNTGRALHDVNAFRFFTVQNFPDESED